MIGDRKYMTSEVSIADRMEEDGAIFQIRFSRCRRLLCFIATRVLGGSERAEEATENCRLAASCHPPRFEHESAFRSWLLRVLIDEALAIRRHSEETIATRIPVEQIPSEGSVCITYVTWSAASVPDN
jgi:DNA-directed RNA polymerase specialized sigma24 family protein